MSDELIAVVIGAVIAITGGIVTNLLSNFAENRRRAKSIRAVAAAEIVAIKEKAQRYVDGNSTHEELGASTPMLTSIARELGNLTPEQAINFRRVVTLDMEMRKASGDQKKKALTAIGACEGALTSFS